eukprot:gnl/MRDRNA2_/MRDRNA2_73173_c0_seq1.p2 gnl/MRDRNA2_/MRDRNA2_73173_c0~~gnl/MRDRNA2_/MRDRNA2_73173_c0_seq1.p2  ORF type:complete len:192 (-),score=44.77 gnl/MRDRNA2_/MRDRNA2_73173_c0_seq1:227-802(-)
MSGVENLEVVMGNAVEVVVGLRMEVEDEAGDTAKVGTETCTDLDDVEAEDGMSLLFEIADQVEDDIELGLTGGTDGCVEEVDVKRRSNDEDTNVDAMRGTPETDCGWKDSRVNVDEAGPETEWDLSEVVVADVGNPLKEAGPDTSLDEEVNVVVVRVSRKKNSETDCDAMEVRSEVFLKFLVKVANRDQVL